MRILPIALLAVACSSTENGDAPPAPPVLAAAETEPVASHDDAADDPAIWVNRGDPAASLILGTDKQAGLYAYDLSGAVKQFIEAGELNNVDLRQDVKLGAWTGDIAAASNRTDDTISLFTIGEAGELTPSGSFPSVIAEPYGLCMGAAGEDALVFVAYKTGDLVMYRLTGADSGEEFGRLKFDSQLEGCVFDDEMRILYIGEEERGVWKSYLDEAGLGEPALIDEAGGENGLVADVEGLALYKGAEGAGYLMASSQGNNSYAVYDRRGDNAFLGRFVIGDGPDIDGTQETDGIEAASVNFGEVYPEGVFIAQDGENAPKGSPQNFKIVDFRQVTAALAANSATSIE